MVLLFRLLCSKKPAKLVVWHLGWMGKGDAFSPPMLVSRVLQLLSELLLLAAAAGAADARGARAALTPPPGR